MMQRTMMTMAAMVAVAGAAQADNNKAASDQQSLIGVQKKTDPKTAIFSDPARKWFPEGGLGLFIHWGFSSVDGHHDLSWGMMKNCPGSKETRRYSRPTTGGWPKSSIRRIFHPERWLRAAKDAGFSYAVLTTRHHEGFALWPSDCGDFNTKNYIKGRNLVREYVDACRKAGIKVGFYYSPPDCATTATTCRSATVRRGRRSRRIWARITSRSRCQKSRPASTTNTPPTSTAKSAS